MKLEETSPEKGRYKLVRLDDCTDIAGDIVKADDETGEYVLTRTVAGETKTEQFNAAANSIRIVARGR